MDIFTAFVTLETSADFFKGLFLGTALTATASFFVMKFFTRHLREHNDELRQELKDAKNETKAFKDALIKQQNLDMIGSIFKEK
ncbi:hypothetical protein [Campylobacter vulpis]|uniref:hypothetical protein n=1 Tax=Campylobacter vulpis TaxID=1655500 RepID=UPI000C14B0DE|nr:hypothetical protein [Campylobacter vulpis]MBS4275601.1 hypothetical protein [Campylobacter vulpis]MBS4306816.1 hypothetical protein [Campylobacter vulpis]MBS4329924.1 hypothetical protein [Campylobacter vulpis]MBS4423571.1 hypothetical protein [Campylobacter vulpis]PHY89914.1 hypothetical protein AA995_07185 [Campylobacter vulpis]